MANAVAAAKTSSMLTAEIMPMKYTAATQIPADSGKSVGDYTTQFEVTFSDNVKLPANLTSAQGGDDNATTHNAVERRGSVLDPTMYRLNGRRLQAYVATAPDETGSVQDLIFTADRTVTITLSHHLEAGDTISVVGGGKVGAAMDQRPLEDASLTLSAVTIAADRTAPIVEIVAVPGQSSFQVFVTEPNILHSELVTGPTGSRTAGSNWRDFVMVQGPSRAAETFEGDTTTAPADATALGRKGAHERYTVTVDQALAKGDVITIERSAVIDTDGRRSALTRHTVGAVKTNTAPPTGTGNFEVQSVSIGNYVHGTQAGANIVNAAATTTMTVTAKATGIASGARGNSWTLFGFDDRTFVNGNAFNIRVAVDAVNQRISYTISDVRPQTPNPARPNGPTIGDLAAALVSNDDFNANFAVSYVDGGTLTTKSAALGTPDPAGLTLMGGLSQVGVVVRFNDEVHTLANGGVDLAGDIAQRLDTGASPADVATVTWATPDNQVHISYTSASMLRLPARSGFRVIAASVATNHDGAGDAGVGNIREILNSLRPDASIKP
ncbi:MAG: hypothetical protein OXI97_17570, partial [Acidimicrobiaceae bacterium]|nr:hypothetical protein [Acidimicrobiaceae bacterium]